MGSDHIGDVSLDEGVGGFDMFRHRALASYATEDVHWRVGFDASFRAGYEAKVAAAIFDQMAEARLGGSAGDAELLIDIGAGASPLTESLTRLCESYSLIHVVVDSEEMLSHLPPHPCRQKIVGRFPDVLNDDQSLIGKAHFVLAYSVLQYVVRDMAAESFVRAAASLLAPSGVLLIGDIPNRDMRDRQMLASGIEPPPASTIDIRDELLIDLICAMRKMGFHAFLTSQRLSEPMRLHREQLIVCRPGSY